MDDHYSYKDGLQTAIEAVHLAQAHLMDGAVMIADCGACNELIPLFIQEYEQGAIKLKDTGDINLDELLILIQAMNVVLDELYAAMEKEK